MLLAPSTVQCGDGRALVSSGTVTALKHGADGDLRWLTRDIQGWVRRESRPERARSARHPSGPHTNPCVLGRWPRQCFACLPRRRERIGPAESVQASRTSASGGNFPPVVGLAPSEVSSARRAAAPCKLARAATLVVAARGVTGGVPLRVAAADGANRVVPSIFREACEPRRSRARSGRTGAHRAHALAVPSIAA